MKTWTTTECFWAIIHSLVRIFVYPLIVRADNGSIFLNQWKEMWKERGCIVSNSLPYHPQGNGQIERSFRTLKDRLKAILTEIPGISWLDALPFVQGSHNSLTRTSLGGYSPAEVMLGYKPRWENVPRLHTLPSDIEWLDANQQRFSNTEIAVKEAVAKYKEQSQKYQNKTRIAWEPKVGDMILCSRIALSEDPKVYRGNLCMEYVGPMIITKNYWTNDLLHLGRKGAKCSQGIFETSKCKIW